MESIDAVQAVFGKAGAEINWWQMSLRAVVIFAYGVFLVRLAGRRVFGQLAPLDIVVSLIIGSNLSRALTGTVPLIETLIASTALVILHAAVSWLLIRIPALSPLIKGRAIRLVRDGEVDKPVARRNGLGDHDMDEALRAGGVEDCGQVSGAWLERNGKISVVKRS
jgi:uncharacterized membrane protein YcaP (DUF421 family)